MTIAKDIEETAASIANMRSTFDWQGTLGDRIIVLEAAETLLQLLETNPDVLKLLDRKHCIVSIEPESPWELRLARQ